MAKTQEELNALKEELETMNKKLAELTEEELAKVSGGELPRIVPDERFVMFSHAGDWESDNKLPTEPGSYKVSHDIELEGKLIYVK